MITLYIPTKDRPNFSGRLLSCYAATGYRHWIAIADAIGPGLQQSVIWRHAIKAGKASRTPQDPAKAISHRAAQFRELDWIDLDATHTARDLINLIRARTFPPYPSIAFRDGDKQVQSRVQLEYTERVRSEAPMTAAT